MNQGPSKRVWTLLLTFVFSALVFCLPGYFLYLDIKGLIIDELGKSATNVAVSVAELIEQDLDSYTALYDVTDYTEGNYDEEYYQHLLAVFQELKADIQSDYIYTEKYIDEDTICYLIDGENPQSENFSAIGELDETNPYSLQVFHDGVILATPVLKYDRWGSFLTGYAPIIDDESGRILGLVGVDFSLTYVNRLINSVRLILTLALTILVFLSTYVIYKLMDLRMEALNKDYLTGLYSKRYQEYRLKKAIREAKMKNSPLSLIMLDLDNFKEINDTHGHLVGDRVLKDVASVLSFNTRNVDICSRYGGDEFLILLPNTLPESAVGIAEAIMKNVTKLVVMNGEQTRLTLSVGIAEWDHTSDYLSMIQQADKAMYVSKNLGKDKWTIYH